MSNLDKAINAMFAPELMGVLSKVLSHSDYVESLYTPIMQDLLKHYQRKPYELSFRQRSAIETHLKIHRTLWF